MKGSQWQKSRSFCGRIGNRLKRGLKCSTLLVHAWCQEVQPHLRDLHNRNSELHNTKLLHRRRRQTKHHLSQTKLMCVCEEMADLGAGDIVFFDESEAKILKGSRC